MGNELHRQNVQTSIANLTSVEITSGIHENVLVAIGSTNAKPLRDRLPGEGDPLMISRFIVNLVLALLIAIPALAGADESAPASGFGTSGRSDC